MALTTPEPNAAQPRPGNGKRMPPRLRVIMLLNAAVAAFVVIALITVNAYQPDLDRLAAANAAAAARQYVESDGSAAMYRSMMDRAAETAARKHRLKEKMALLENELQAAKSSLANGLVGSAGPAAAQWERVIDDLAGQVHNTAAEAWALGDPGMQMDEARAGLEKLRAQAFQRAMAGEQTATRRWALFFQLLREERSVWIAAGLGFLAIMLAIMGIDALACFWAAGGRKPRREAIWAAPQEKTIA